MSEYQEALFILVVVGTVTVIIPWFHRRFVYNRDSGKIISFIRESKYTFRSTESIAEGTGIARERVQEICRLHDSIIRNKKRPDTWRVM